MTSARIVCGLRDEETVKRLLENPELDLKKSRRYLSCVGKSPRYVFRPPRADRIAEPAVSVPPVKVARCAPCGDGRSRHVLLPLLRAGRPRRPGGVPRH